MFSCLKRALVVAVIFTFQFSFAAAPKIGFVDVQRAIEGTTLGKSAIKEMKEKVASLQKELDKKKGDLKKLGDDLQRKKDVLSEEVLRTKQGEYQQEMMKVSQFAQTGQIDLQKKEKELMDPIISKLKVVIDDVAKAEKYSMVLNQTPQNPSVLFYQKDVDLTDKIIAAFEKKHSKKGK